MVPAQSEGSTMIIPGMVPAQSEGSTMIIPGIHKVLPRSGVDTAVALVHNTSVTKPDPQFYLEICRIFI